MSCEMRINMAEVLPSAIQPFPTYVTGYPIPGLKPLWTTTPAQETIGTAVWFLASVFACGWCWTTGGWWVGLVPIFWLHTVGAARKSLAQIIHYAMHNRPIKSRLVNRVMGQIFTTILILQSFLEYLRDHVELHHRDAVAAAKASQTRSILFPRDYRKRKQEPA